MSNENQTTTNGLLNPNGSVTTFSGDVVLEPNEERAKEYHSREPIVNKFLNPDGSVSTLGEIIDGGGDVDLPIDFTSIDLPPILAGAVNANQSLSTFRTRAGNYYINCGASTYPGVFCFDVPNKTITKVSTMNIYGLVNWFEDSKGNVYSSCTGASYFPGLFRITPTDVINLNNENFSNYLAQHEHSGIVYFGSNASAGILAVNNTTFAVTRPITTGVFRSFFGTSDGTVYASGTTANTGIYAITGNGTVATQISNIGANWTNFYESKNGRVFVSSGTSGTANIGIYHLTPTSATQIYDQYYNWQFWYEFETSCGLTENQIYVSSSTGNAGIVLIKPDNISSLINATAPTSAGINYNQTYQTQNDTIYFFNDYSASLDCALKVIPSSTPSAVQFSSKTSTYRDIVEDSMGNLFMRSESTATTNSDNAIYSVMRSTGTMDRLMRYNERLKSLTLTGNILKAVTVSNVEYTIDITPDTSGQNPVFKAVVTAMKQVQSPLPKITKLTTLPLLIVSGQTPKAVVY